MPFKDIKGNDSAVTFLKNAVKSGRVSHSYIFLGPSGVGKMLAALNFAAALNCANLLDADPCGLCISCAKIKNFNHPDVSILKPEKINGSIKIDDVRRLTQEVSLKPYEGRKKVYIIDEASSMTNVVSNALLKTLEEPATDSAIILITENLSDLLKTIASRSQIVRFYPLRTSEVKKILMDEYKVEDTEAHIISVLSGGRIGDALKYKDNDLLKERAKLIDGILDKTLFDLNAEVPKEDTKFYLETLLSWYRDLLVSKTGLGADYLINIDRAEDIAREARPLEVNYLKKSIDEIILTSSYLDQSANSKIAITALGLKLEKNGSATCMK